MQRLSRQSIFLLLLTLALPGSGLNAAETVTEGDLSPFLSEARLETHVLFTDERFPNAVVSVDGSVLATWGRSRVCVRRSEDGGHTWGPEIVVGPGIHAGGVIVDEQHGAVLVFVHPEHPPTDGTTAPRTVYRSLDHGISWSPVEADWSEDSGGFIPSLHMSEHGVTLRHGPHAGRLIRPARVYRRSPDRYSSTVYSDDGGRSWTAGQPVPIQGSGEGALLELASGRLIYTARRSYFADGVDFVHARHYALSDDGGQSWKDTSTFGILPDGPRYRGRQKQGANYNGHFGMMAGFVRLPVKGRDILLYSNADHDGHERRRLTVWASFDGGNSWPVRRLVHEGPSAYSSLAVGRPGTASDGWIYLQYEYGESGRQYAGSRLARFNLSWLLQGNPTGDGRVPRDLK